MSDGAIEFVETWVEEKIEEMDELPSDVEAEAKTLASQCISDAENDGLTQADIEDVFDDLPAFIAAEIEEAFDNGDDSDADGFDLVDDDDDRLVDNEDEDDDEDDDQDKKD